jgi:hypothetical protein
MVEPVTQKGHAVVVLKRGNPADRGNSQAVNIGAMFIYRDKRDKGGDRGRRIAGGRQCKSYVEVQTAMQKYVAVYADRVL